MKKRTILNSCIGFAAISILFASCATDKTQSFSARKYTHFKKGETTVFVNPSAPENNFSTTENTVSKNNFSDAENQKNNFSVATNKVENANPISITKSTKKIFFYSNKKENINTIFPVSANVKTTHSVVKTKIIPIFSAIQKADNADKIVEIICAIIIPPLGVYLHDKAINTHFWIDLVLTFFFFLPGIIYALLIVTDSI